MTLVEREALPVDEETGLKYFVVMGQKRYLCPTLWESGAVCWRDHYDRNYILEHASEAHTASGTKKLVAIQHKKVTSALVDDRGRHLEYEIPADMNDVHFKKK